MAKQLDSKEQLKQDYRKLQELIGYVEEKAKTMASVHHQNFKIEFLQSLQAIANSCTFMKNEVETLKKNYQYEK